MTFESQISPVRTYANSSKGMDAGAPLRSAMGVALKELSDVLFELHRIGIKQPNAFAQFFGRHRIFI